MKININGIFWAFAGIMAFMAAIYLGFTALLTVHYWIGFSILPVAEISSATVLFMIADGVGAYLLSQLSIFCWDHLG